MSHSQADASQPACFDVKREILALLALASLLVQAKNGYRSRKDRAFGELLYDGGISNLSLLYDYPLRIRLIDACMV